MNILSPSILSADFSRLDEELNITMESGAQWAHLDVMDGIFVPNITFGAPVIRSIKRPGRLFFDAHLMIVEPIRYLEDFAKAGCDLITIHYEACKDVKGTLEAIKDLGVKAGLAIKPETEAEAVKKYLDIIDLALVMSVPPGFSGQKFMPDTLEKTRKIRQWIDGSGKDIYLEMDGGIGLDNVGLVLDAGCDVVVAGSAVYPGAEDNIKKFMEKLNGNS